MNNHANLYKFNLLLLINRIIGSSTLILSTANEKKFYFIKLINYSEYAFTKSKW